MLNLEFYKKDNKTDLTGRLISNLHIIICDFYFHQFQMMNYNDYKNNQMDAHVNYSCLVYKPRYQRKIKEF